MCMINEAVALAFAVAILVFVLDSGLQVSVQRKAFITANLAVIISSLISIMIITIGGIFNPLEIFPTRILVALINISGVLVAVTFVHYAFSILIDNDIRYLRFKRLSWSLFAFVSLLIVYISMTSSSIDYQTLGERPDPYITIAPITVFLYVLWIIVIAALNRSQAVIRFFNIILGMAIVGVISIWVQVMMPEVMLNSITAAFILMISSLYLQNKKALLDDTLEIQNRTAFHNDVAFKKNHPKDDVLIMIELCDVRSYLDTHGAVFAQTMIETVVNQLIQIYGRNTLYKYSTDTFALHFQHRQGILIKDAEVTLKDLFQTPFEIDGTEVSLSAKIYTFTLAMIQDDDLIAVIEYAKATHHGLHHPNLLTIDEAFMRLYHREKAIAKTIALTLSQGEIDVVYQPIYDIKTKTYTRMEALARLHDPIYGKIAPQEFIQIAERSSLINDLGASVIRTSIATMASLLKEGSSITNVSVNLSAIEVADMRLVQTVLDALNSASLDPRCLSFEVTETVFVKNNNDLQRLSKDFKRHHINMILDDFGTGFANIEAVFSGIFETVKFDGTLFRKMLEDQKGPDVISHMIGLFHSLGIKATIEGIETNNQKLEAIGASADELQGFFLKRPMTKEDLVQFVSKH